MEKRTIYRIEDPETGDGFWRSSTNGFYNGLKLLNHSRYEAISDRHNDATKFPSHSQDTELNSKINNFAIQFYHFAFLSMDQIKEALTLEEIKELRRDFGLKGNKRIGYTLSPKVEDRVGMCSAVQEMEAQWSAVHEMTEALPEHI